MLTQLKRSARNIFVTGLLGLLVLAFAVWGISDVFRGRTTTDVAHVGGRAISATLYQIEFRNRVRALAEQSGGLIDTAQARALGVDQQVLMNLMNRAALAEAADNLGLTVSNRALSDTIRNNPAFRGPQGQFSRDTYRMLLAENQLSENMYETALRDDMAVGQLIDTVLAGHTVSRKMAEALYSYAGEIRSVEYLVLPPEAAGTIEDPTPEEIEAYYNDNAAQFTAPEYRRFTYLLVEAKDLEKAVEISEDEVKELYEFNKARFEEPERRTVQILPFMTEEEARKAEESLASGSSFEALAESRDLAMEQVTSEKALQSDLLDAAVGKAAFELQPNVVSAPVNGDLGWAIVRVTEIFPGTQKSFEEASADIRKEIAEERSHDLLNDMFDRVEDEISGGATVEETAQRLNLTAVKVAAADQRGRGPDGKAAPGVPESVPAVLSEAFSVEPGQEGDVLDSKTDGFFTIRVDSATPPALKSLDMVQSDVKSSIVAGKREKRLTEIAQSIVARASSGTSFADLAADQGRSVLKTAQPIRRDFTNDAFSDTLVAKLFAAKEGEFVQGPVSFGASRVVAVTREIEKPDVAAGASEIDMLRQQLEDQVANDVASLYVRGLLDTFGASTNEAAVETALGGPQL